MKTILILGAESDVAKALTALYVQKGYHVIEASRHSKTHYFDAADFESHASFYRNLSPKPIGVISVFGYMGSQIRAETSFSECKTIIDATYLGHVSILNIIANDFEKKRSGFIIGISSVAGLRGRMSNYIYGSAKAGFTTYLSGLRNRLWPAGVHVMTVIPGFINSKMTTGITLPPILTADPTEVARSILKAQEKQKNIVYIYAIWKIIMFIICSIPESIFKKLKL